MVILISQFRRQNDECIANFFTHNSEDPITLGLQHNQLIIFCIYMDSRQQMMSQIPNQGDFQSQLLWKSQPCANVSNNKISLYNMFSMCETK